MDSSLPTRCRSLSAVSRYNNDVNSSPVEDRKRVSIKSSLGHDTNRSIKKEKDKDRDLKVSQDTTNVQANENTELFLTITTQSAISTKNKKKPSFKASEVKLYFDRLEITTSKGVTPIYLNSLCMVQQEESLRNSTNSTRVSSPFSGSLSRMKDRADRTILLCTRDLSRIWLRFDEKKDFLLWILSLDGLLANKFQSSLLDPTVKSLFLRESFLQGYKGGSIKVGDDEEWTYLGSSGNLICTLCNDDRIKDAKFVFDGQYLRPEYTFDTPFNAEWDGMNLYWYSDSVGSAQSDRKRKRQAELAYNWNESLQEFRLILPDQSITTDVNQTFKFIRTFFARKNSEGDGWLQAEGDLPVCLLLCLQIFRSLLNIA